MPKAGTTTARGYGGTHQKLRAQWTPLVDAGQVWCHRPTCGEWIKPGTPWDLGHDDETGAWRGPEHRNCNRAAGARKRNGEQEAAAMPRTSRRW